MIRFSIAIVIWMSIAHLALAQEKFVLESGTRAERMLNSGNRARIIVEYHLPTQRSKATQSSSARIMQIEETRSALLNRVFGKSLNANSLDENGVDLTVVRTLRNFPAFAINATNTEIAQLNADPLVHRIYADTLSAVSLQEAIQQIRASDVYQLGYSGSGNAVAILDTGVSFDHAMLSGSVVGSACFSGETDAIQSSLCPNGLTQQLGGTAGTNCPVDDPATGPVEGIPGCGHGTHVAGIAVGGDIFFPTEGALHGVAKTASLVPIQVFTKFLTADDCDTDPVPCLRSYESDQLAALDYVLTNAATLNIRAANMSLASGQSSIHCDGEHTAMTTIIDDLRAANVATIVAAGNNFFTSAISYPACIAGAIAVGATTEPATGQSGSSPGSVPGFSNSAPILDLLAPGKNVFSAYPVIGNVHYGAESSGTSMAAPMVSGAIAILAGANPNASIDEITNAIIESGVPVVDYRNSVWTPFLSLGFANSAIAAETGANAGPIEITPKEGYYISVTQGDQDTVITKTYTLSNTSNEQVSFEVKVFDNWLISDKSSGTIAANGSTTVTVRNHGASNPGIETGTIEFVISPTKSIFRKARKLTKSDLPNDLFAGRKFFFGTFAEIDGENLSATREASEPQHAGQGETASVWHSWRTPYAGEYFVTTEDSDFDTTLAVYSGTALDELTLLGSNDDENGSTQTSRLAFTAEAGKEYAIAIDGFKGARGNFSLTLSPTETPDNDDFVDARQLDSASGFTDGTNANATGESGEPEHVTGRTASSTYERPTVWFKWTPNFTGDAFFNGNGTDFNLATTVYTGSDVGRLTKIDSMYDDPQSHLMDYFTFPVVAGTEYHIGLEGSYSWQNSSVRGYYRFNYGQVGGDTVPMFTSILPTNRWVLRGNTASAFLAAANGGNEVARACAPFVNVSSTSRFEYQSIDPAGNLIGTANTPVDIPVGGIQNYVFGINFDDSRLRGESVYIPISCENVIPPDPIEGLNTFGVGVTNEEMPDILAVGATVEPGVIRLDGPDGTGFMTTSAVNIGRFAFIAFRAELIGFKDEEPFYEITVCETDPATAICLHPPNDRQAAFAANPYEVHTFAVFISANGNTFDFDPANLRLVAKFIEPGTLITSTSVAVLTDSGD